MSKSTFKTVVLYVFKNQPHIGNYFTLLLRVGLDNNRFITFWIAEWNRQNPSPSRIGCRRTSHDCQLFYQSRISVRRVNQFFSCVSTVFPSPFLDRFSCEYQKKFQSFLKINVSKIICWLTMSLKNHSQSFILSPSMSKFKHVLRIITRNLCTKTMKRERKTHTGYANCRSRVSTKNTS